MVFTKMRKNRIKTWPQNGFIFLGFWGEWRRWNVVNPSSSTTSVSWKSKQYKVDSWQCFDFGAFMDDFCRSSHKIRNCQKCPQISIWPWVMMSRPNIVRILIILAQLKSWGCQLSNGTKLVKLRPVQGRFVAMFWFAYHKHNIPHIGPHFSQFPCNSCSIDSLQCRSI